jgi:hypothetical protein
LYIDEINTSLNYNLIRELYIIIKHFYVFIFISLIHKADDMIELKLVFCTWSTLWPTNVIDKFIKYREQFKVRQQLQRGDV